MNQNALPGPDDVRGLARTISLVENDLQGSSDLLESLPPRKPETFVIGITGPPGAGKSTLVSALTTTILESDENAKVAVLAVDPTSPFSHGSILGDRLRMTEHFNNPRVYIRSVATRGALGGLSARTPQIADVMIACGFSHVIIETVGVGQSELEIAALADTTVVVFVPESGDDIQTIKSGIMEIADIFVVNKCDRDGADKLVHAIQSTLHERPAAEWNPPVHQTSAVQKRGIGELLETIEKHHQSHPLHPQKKKLLADKAVRLLQQHLLSRIDLSAFEKSLMEQSGKPEFNLYLFTRRYAEGLKS